MKLFTNEFYSSNPRDALLAAQILRALGHLTQKYRFSLRRGWSAIIEFSDAKAGSDDVKMVGPAIMLGVEKEYTHDVASHGDQGERDNACLMVSVLKQFELRATGYLAPYELGEPLHKIVANGGATKETADTVYRQLCELGTMDQAPDTLLRQLTEWGITTRKGGICVPYHLNSAAIGAIAPTQGKLYIAFSGALPWQNLFFATQLLAAIQRALNEIWQDTQFQYDLSSLQSHAELQMLLELAGATETPI